jgi:hypothetical protein
MMLIAFESFHNICSMILVFVVGRGEVHAGFCGEIQEKEAT